MDKIDETEVDDLNYAACELVAALDKLFAGKVKGWKLDRRGFDLEVEPGRHRRERLLRIRPWRSSLMIGCRFDHLQSGWVAYKGVVTSLNIAALPFDFRAHLSPDEGLVILGRGSKDEELLSRVKRAKTVFR